MTIYLDNHATTRIDPAVMAVMNAFMESHYANPGSTTHEAGREANRIVTAALTEIARFLNADADEVVVTSGATESNNLALFGVALHPKQTRRRLVTATTEHRAILDPLLRLERQGFEIIRLPVFQQGHPLAGVVDMNQVADAIDENTALVTIMLANNEIGTIQPIQEIAELCKRFQVPLHTDASQAVGRIPVDVQELGVDLLSFSAHKFYGPKGIGGLFVRQSPDSVRLHAQILGGGQQLNLRSGTLNSVGIVGMAKAISICQQLMQSDTRQHILLRKKLWELLNGGIDGLVKNGPSNEAVQLPNNLNIRLPKVDGQSLMLMLPDLCVSSGSACTSLEPHPSHVLLALGLSEDQARASLRFGLGRFNNEQEISNAAEALIQAHASLAAFAV